MIIELAERDVHLREIWRESDGLLGHAPELCQLRFTHLLNEPMTLDAALDETRHGEREVWIARNGLPVPGSRLVERLRLQRTIGQAFLVLALQKEVVSSRVLCWSSRERAGFRRGKFRLERIGDLLRDLALHGKDIFHLAVVRFGPEMRIGASVDQLHVNAHFVGGLLHTAFQNGRDSELLRYCL